MLLVSNEGSDVLGIAAKFHFKYEGNLIEWINFYFSWIIRKPYVLWFQKIIIPREMEVMNSLKFTYY